MSILGINSDEYEIRLNDMIKSVHLIVSGHSGKSDSFEDYQRAKDYIDGKIAELETAIRNLPPGVPSGPTLRKIIWNVLGIWLSVRTDGKLIFQQGQNLAKYYRICEPADLVPPGGTPRSDFKIKSKDGIIYTHVSISLYYNTTAPHDGYKY